MTKQFFIDAIVWGITLWLIGYVLGIVLFFVVPSAFLGWVIMPIGIFVTLWVLWKKVKPTSFTYFVSLAIFWTAIAVVCDYFLLVKVFNPADGYYKLDVYVYYAVTFLLPLFVGWGKYFYKKKR